MNIKYFNPGRVYSHNCTLNFVVSVRGAGKTYSTLLYSIIEFITKDHQFVYVRRTEKELLKTKDKIFLAHKANNCYSGDIYILGDTILYQKTKQSDAVVMGYVIPLSMVHQYKSSSFPRVKYLIFDEFIEERDVYLKNEPEKLLSLIETIFRTKPIKCILLGNLISFYNPYFTYFNIPCIEDCIWKDKKRGILYYHFKSDTYSDNKKKTPFAKLIENTPYGNFILDNTNILDDNSLIKRNTGKKDIWVGFIHNNMYFHIFRIKEGIYVIEKNKEHDVNMYNIDKIFRDESYNVAKNHIIMRILKRYASRGKIYFGDMKSKIACEQIYFSKQLK